MSTFEIVVIVMLFLIWAQRSEGLRRMAIWLTRKRRILWQKVKRA